MDLPKPEEIPDLYIEFGVSPIKGVWMTCHTKPEQTCGCLAGLLAAKKLGSAEEVICYEGLDGDKAMARLLELPVDFVIGMQCGFDGDHFFPPKVRSFNQASEGQTYGVAARNACVARGMMAA